MNIITEHGFGTGAIETPKIRFMPTAPRSAVPFNWTTGFQLAPLVTKNQGQAGSCGGEAVSYKGEAESGIPKSARFPYSQVFQPGGGSNEPDLIKIIVTEGLCDEAVLPSYPSPGVLPTEAFMDSTQGINAQVLANANPWQGTPVYVTLDFDSIAEAVRDNGGVIIGIYGANNGTWLGVNPQPPTQMNGDWGHWLCVVGCSMYNGQKSLQIKNSWGDDVGIHGVQSLCENYLPYIFTAWTFDKSKYVFNNNLLPGQTSEDVFALQARLGILPTGFFGNITLAAVTAYQKAHGITPAPEVGPLTRAKLNAS